MIRNLFKLRPGRSRKDQPRQRRGWKSGRVKRSRMIRDRLSDGRTLCGSIRALSADVDRRVQERLAPHLGAGESMPDHALALELVARSLEQAMERLRAAEGEYCRQGTRCVRPRRECERFSRQELYPEVVKVRRALDMLFGKADGVAIHCMQGPTRRKARRLEPQVQLMVLGLKDQLPKMALPGMGDLTSDRDKWLRMVEPGLEKLEELLHELQLLEHGQNAALERKQEELAAYDAVYGEALGYVEGVYGLAGMGDRLVRHLRSYFQRRRLSREARRERKARAAGRRGWAKETTRATVASFTGWLSRKRTASR